MVCDVLFVDGSAQYSILRSALLVCVGMLCCRARICSVMLCHDMISSVKVCYVMMGYVLLCCVMWTYVLSCDLMFVDVSAQYNIL